MLNYDDLDFSYSEVWPQRSQSHCYSSKSIFSFISFFKSNRNEPLHEG